MHYLPTHFKTNVDDNPPRDVVSARAALFALLRNQTFDAETRANTEAVPVVRPRIPKPTSEFSERSKWYSALHEEDNFVFCSVP